MTAVVAPSVRGDRRLGRVTAAVVWLSAVGQPLLLAALLTQLPSQGRDAWAIPAYSALITTWGILGALLATRRPGNLTGWVVWAIGAVMAASLLGQVWANLSLAEYAGSLPGTAAAAWSAWAFIPSLACAMLLLPLLFPDGDLPSRRWRVVAAWFAVALAAVAVGQIIRPGAIDGAAGFTNPTGVAGLEDLSGAILSVGNIGVVAGLPVAIAAAVQRYRHGTRLARQQLKWFGSAAGLAALGLIGATVLPEPFGGLSFVVATVALGLVPVAIGIAILRYRLYDIDRIISRTIGWALVSGVVGAAFVFVVVALQAVLTGVTQGQTLAVAASTLVAFALFQPVRRRIQQVVDRRFNRSHADAQVALDAFAERLRGRADLTDVRSDVIETVGASVHPRSVGLWVRDGVGSGS